MPKINLSFEITENNISELNALLSKLAKEDAPFIKPAEPKIKMVEAVKEIVWSDEIEELKEQEPKAEEPKTTKKIEMADVRAAALKLSKANKQDEFKALLDKYNAAKLSDVAEADYPALLADLEAV